MEKIINKLINDFTEGVDTYTHNGSTWLIFTESKQWVIELTDGKTLWYNYNFFKGIFSYTSMDVVDNQQYITKWVEDNIINKVEHTSQSLPRKCSSVDDIIQDGVRRTDNWLGRDISVVEDTIQNGIKETIECNWNIPKYVINEVVNDGVKDTQSNPYENKSWIEGVIKNGVRKTLWIATERESLVETTINNGVKETNPVDVMKFFDNKMEDALQNGVKETKQKKNAYLVLDTSGRELILESHLVIRDGVKETNYDTDNYTDDVNEVIREGVRTSHPRQYVGEKMIDKGVIETHREICEYKNTVDYIIQTGVKEIHEDVYHHKGRIDGVIKNGVKEIYNYKGFRPRNIVDIIDNGEKINGTYAGGQRQSEKCKSVVEYGIKNPTD
jgi:hypothetical protein